MESMNKRCVFLEHVVGIIGSSNVQIVRGRAEVNSFVLIRILIWLFNVFLEMVMGAGQSLGQNLCYREKFDIAVARAVAETRILGTIGDILII